MLITPRYKQRRQQREREAFRQSAAYRAMRPAFAETLFECMAEASAPCAAFATSELGARLAPPHRLTRPRLRLCAKERRNLNATVDAHAGRRAAQAGPAHRPGHLARCGCAGLVRPMTGIHSHDKRVDPASACAGKDRFDNRAAAKSVADRMLKRRDARINAYACAACRGWHLGSQITNLEAKKKAARRALQAGDHLGAVRRQQLEDLPVEQRAALRKGRG